jgi:predicted GNAT superfamily acetyltransferase
MISPWSLSILEQADDMPAVEALQRLVWPGSDAEILPAHMLLAAVHNGGLLIGAFLDKRLVGFVFSFLGMSVKGTKQQLKHHSHMLGVHPDYRSHGIGFALKRAQWQMVRKQGIELITWTYDPLLSRNAWLNIARLGTVCETYYVDYYGELRDALNLGLPTDRFQVDWWLNTRRVNLRLSHKARGTLDLAHYLAADTPILNLTHLDPGGWPKPAEETRLPEASKKPSLLLVEIPADFNGLKAANPELALRWRLSTREIFQALFSQGYLVTDFIHLSGITQRSFYVLSYGEATL